jgi:hypothetical protein
MRPKHEPFFRVPGNPPREWRACRDAARRGGCIVRPPLYKSQSIYSIQRQHSFSDTRTEREREREREREGGPFESSCRLPPPQQPLSRSERHRDGRNGTACFRNAAMGEMCTRRVFRSFGSGLQVTFPSTGLRRGDSRVPSTARAAESRMRRIVS